MSNPTSRPGSVTFVVVLVWIYAIMMLISGGLWLWMSNDSAFVGDVDVDAGEAQIYGWTILVMGLITLLTAIGLGRGSRLARFIVNAVMTLRIIADVLGLLLLTGYPLWQAVVSIAWAALILVLLNNRASSRWFLGA
ncbi:DUF7144 family membrane protein [Demequina globuliformis]|uniref:DUF7144 family membrane protein n=1 Tax=Demequina globuliformis TaxID=676202 RepID=UPI0007843157|nr:hypothetical protein [Demequina globuliformis]